MPINCAAIPNELIEAELFGYVRGAFSGAVGELRRPAARGRRAARVFLDEIDDTPLTTQVKLLRVLEDGEVTRLGETRGAAGRLPHRRRDQPRPAGADRAGALRRRPLPAPRDRARIELPPLRERREDIAALARHFIGALLRAEPACRATVRDGRRPRALAALRAHPWPGNVRELRNVIYQALVYKLAGSELLLSDLRPLLERREDAAPTPETVVNLPAVRTRIEAGTFNLRREVQALETEALRYAVEKSAGRPTTAARLLGEVGRGHSSDPGGTVRAMMRRLL